MTADNLFNRLDDDDYPACTMGRAAEILGTTPGFRGWARRPSRIFFAAHTGGADSGIPDRLFGGISQWSEGC